MEKSQENTLNLTEATNEEIDRLPYFIEDDTQYEGKSYFCNIDAFSAQGCQPFPKVRMKIRHAPQS